MEFHEKGPDIYNKSLFEDPLGYNYTGNLFSNMCENSTANSTCNYSASADNSTELSFNPLPLWQLIVLGSLASFTSLMTIFGNLVVILSFVLERQIRQPTNYFIASLAVSDLLIGSISMPFYTVYLLAGQYWPLGDLICDMWLSTDYTLCLTSIYTVFCITVDRFCSVKIPAKYRNWRTDKKVLIIITLTWIIPSVVFFTSIMGWQYIVGERSVKKGMCYVQYLDIALFNCILQVGYFWITLVVMCVLYTGIYHVALSLQRKSDAKHKKMTSLVSMAGQTMTKIGIGMSQQQKIDTSKFFPENGNTLTTALPVEGNPDAANKQGQSSTSFTSSNKNDKDDDRSSSPVFPSDTEPSSQSPKHSPKAKKLKKKKNSTCTAAMIVPKIAPPKNEKRIYKVERHLPNAIASNGSHCLSSLTNIPLPQSLPSYQEATEAQTEQPEREENSDGEKEALLTETDEQEKQEKCEEIDEKCVEEDDRLLPADDAAQKNQDVVDHPESPIWKRRNSYVGDGDQSESVGSLNSEHSGSDNDDQQSHLHHTTPAAPSPVNVQVTATSGSRCVQSVLSNVEDAAPLNGSDAEPAKKTRSFQDYFRSLRGTKKKKDKKASKSENRARKALRTITIILGAFVLCWTPWHVLSMIMSFCPKGETCVESLLYDISYYLCYLNSPINPLCYALANQQFKKTFIRILKLDWHRT